MGPDRRTGKLTSALQLKSRVKKLFKTAPDLYRDYKGMLPVFDRYRQIPTPNIQHPTTPQSLDRGTTETPRVKTELDAGPYTPTVPARQFAAANYGPEATPVHGQPSRAALSPGSPNRVKKEERLDIKRFSEFASGSDQPLHSAAPQPEDIDEDDIHLLMQSIHSQHAEDHPFRNQENAHNSRDPVADHYPSDEEMVNNREAAREDVRRFLSLPETEIPPEERMGTPVAMNCRLMPHQMCGLTWMVRQEEDDDKRGGLLAGKFPSLSSMIAFAYHATDDMGLGKTVQALALILARPSMDEARKTTLIVTPLALLKQWEGEIQKKVKLPYKLKTHIYHGSSKRGLTLQKMLDCDVVLTTYNTIVAEFKRKWGITKAHLAPRHRPLLSSPKLVLLHRDAHFHRVILDEAHMIRNRQTQCSMAVAQLRANYRLCLTGTPFMNNTAEIYPLIRFLDIGPYNQWDLFNSQISKPLNRWSGDEAEVEEIHNEAMTKLQVIFHGIALRRTKSSTLDGLPILRLPEMVKSKVATEFDNDQAAFYHELEQTQRIKLGRYMKSATNNREITMYIFVLLLRLRQACCHPHLIKSLEIPYGCSIGKHQMIKLALRLDADNVDRIQAVKDFRCPICGDSTDVPVIFYPCAHFCCPACFTAMIEIARPVASEGDVAQDQEEVMVPRCPECNDRVHGDKLICYRYFKQAIESGELPASGDMDEDEFSTADEADNGVDLGGFVVSDDESDDSLKREIVEEEDAMMSDSNGDSEVANDPGTMKREDSAPPSGSEDYREPSTMSDANSSPVGGACRSRRPRTRASRQLKPESDSDVEIPDFQMATRTPRPRVSRPNRNLQARAPTSAAAREQYFRTLRSEFVSSAKIDKAMQLLREIGPRKKTLIFSQWTSFLDLLEIPLQDAGYRYTRYDGTMKPAERDEAVKAFQEDPRVKIMLVSLKAGNMGLNLTAAQFVLIMEPDWSEYFISSIPVPAPPSSEKTPMLLLVHIRLIRYRDLDPFIEDQAVDRTHRIGQKNQVTVHRLLIADTVEDRILRLQEKKRTLFRAALNEKGARSVATLTREELLGLFRASG